MERCEKPAPPIEFAIPFLAEQSVDLVIVPKTVPIVLQDDRKKGKARLLLAGELLGHDKPYIREIWSDGFRVHWTASKPTPSKKAVLEITFEATERILSAPKLQIGLVTGKTIVLPTALIKPRVVRD